MKKWIIFAGLFVMIIAASITTLHIYNKNKSCIADWECSEWSGCTKSVQARTCIDNRQCGTLKNKPEVVRSCNMLCFDNIFNQNEEDVDCGGVCESCEAKLAPKKRTSMLIYAGLILVCSAFIVVIYRRGKEARGMFKGEFKGRVDKFKSRLGDVKQGIQIREAVTDPRAVQLESYIKSCLAAGYSNEAIRQSLINSGWPAKTIDTIFEDINNIRIGV